MALYTFFPCLPDGHSSSFETRELPDDDDAEAFALVVLQRHLTCAWVAVWAGDREVCVRRREPPDDPDAAPRPDRETPHGTGKAGSEGRARACTAGRR